MYCSITESDSKIPTVTVMSLVTLVECVVNFISLKLINKSKKDDL